MGLVYKITTILMTITNSVQDILKKLFLHFQLSKTANLCDQSDLNEPH